MCCNKTFSSSYEIRSCRSCLSTKFSIFIPGPLNINNTEMTNDHVYIGRSRKWGPSAWGNPFRCGDHGRESAISRYEVYLFDSGLFKQLHTLYGKILVCHCAPLPCHGDILMKHLYKFEKKEL